MTATPPRLRPLATVDPDVSTAILREQTRQNDGLELIASENFVSTAVMDATGSILTNKYAEGYPGRRYYGGCEFYDAIESLAIARARALFGAEHANVQPHSGAQANMAAYFALLQPGDTVLGMNLSHGGHLTHGHPLNGTDTQDEPADEEPRNTLEGDDLARRVTPCREPAVVYRS